MGIAKTQWVARLLALAGLVLCLPLFGCRWAETVTIEIPDFDSSAVEGVWIWRENADTSDYARSLHFRIDETFSSEGDEYVSYSLLEPDGQKRWTLPALVERETIDSDNVRIRFLLILVEGGGSFRASTYNAVGESGLSAGALDIDPV